MTRTDELLALAGAATSGPWDTNPADALSNELEVTANNHYISVCNAAPYDALLIAAANPETIKQLVELVRLQHEALSETTALCTNYEAVEEDDGYQFTEAPAVIKQGNEAIEAFDKWDAGK
jgi:hypothetical protein